MVGVARVWDCLFRTAARGHGKGFLPHPTNLRRELSDNSPDLDPDFYRIGFRAEYSKTGFAITRLIPVYDYSRPAFGVYPESSPSNLEDWHQSPVDSARELTPGVTGSLKSPTETSGNKDEEESRDGEIWSRLPAWMKSLDDLKQKARRASSK